MKKIVFPLIVLLLFVFIGCEEEEPENVTYLGEYKSYIPFEGGEKLHYWVNDSEKIVLNANEKITSINSFISSHSEEQIMSLSDPTGLSGFLVNLSGSIPFDAPHIQIFYYYIFGEDPLSHRYSNIFTHFFEPSYLEYTPKILDTLSVRDKTYHNVIEIGGSDSYDKMYYCKSDGIIKLQCKRTWYYGGGEQQTDTITYELEKIEWN